MGMLLMFAVSAAVIVGIVSILIPVLTKSGMLGRSAPPSNDEIGELRQAIDAMEYRLAELEERLDFTERVLAKHREADRLGPPPQ